MPLSASNERGVMNSRNATVKWRRIPLEIMDTGLMSESLILRANLAFRPMDTSVVEHQAMITNDAVVLGLLMTILAFVFYTSSKTSGFWPKFYT